MWGEGICKYISPETFLPLLFLHLTYFPDIYIRGYCAVMCADLLATHQNYEYMVDYCRELMPAFFCSYAFSQTSLCETSFDGGAEPAAR